MDHLSKQSSRPSQFKLRSATTSDIKVLESQLSSRELDRKELLERLIPLVGADHAGALLEGKKVDLDIQSKDQAAAVLALMGRVAKFVRNS